MVAAIAATLDPSAAPMASSRKRISCSALATERSSTM
jgi:hypothetical protein